MDRWRGHLLLTADHVLGVCTDSCICPFWQLYLADAKINPPSWVKTLVVREVKWTIQGSRKASHRRASELRQPGLCPFCYTAGHSLTLWFGETGSDSVPTVTLGTVRKLTLSLTSWLSCLSPDPGTAVRIQLWARLPPPWSTHSHIRRLTGKLPACLLQPLCFTSPVLRIRPSHRTAVAENCMLHLYIVRTFQRAHPSIVSFHLCSSPVQVWKAVIIRPHFMVEETEGQRRGVSHWSHVASSWTNQDLHPTASWPGPTLWSPDLFMHNPNPASAYQTIWAKRLEYELIWKGGDQSVC